MVQKTEEEWNEIKKKLKRLENLETYIKQIVTERADRLCWRDIYTILAKEVGINFVPELVAGPEQFIANCKAFDQSLRNGGEYKPVYVEEVK
jgi:hypothetical protein